MSYDKLCSFIFEGVGTHPTVFRGFLAVCSEITSGRFGELYRKQGPNPSQLNSNKWPTL